MYQETDSYLQNCDIWVSLNIHELWLSYAVAKYFSYSENLNYWGFIYTSHIGTSCDIFINRRFCGAIFSQKGGKFENLQFEL